MLEGISPIDAVKPAAHVLVHYAKATGQFGVLKWYWLMAFERFNKKMKNIIGNKACPISSLTHALVRDAGISNTCTCACTCTCTRTFPCTFTCT